MIGLGSNRLTVCRRGGMSVTQAGRGGMEWLAGGRLPSWASPYSAQATAALKAQFPTQWAIIFDFGMNPDNATIVGYINAYAPTDAKIAYSLIPGLGSRWIIANGSGNYFKTGVVPSEDMYVKLIINNDKTATNRIMCARNSYADSSAYGFNIYSNNQIDFDFGTENRFSVTFPANDPLVLELDKNYGKLNGTSYALTVGTRNPTTREFCLPGLNQSAGYYMESKLNNIYSLYIKKTNAEYWFIPFVQNDSIELLDLVSGNLCEKVGSFTISESPAS